MLLICLSVYPVTVMIVGARCHDASNEILRHFPRSLVALRSSSNPMLVQLLMLSNQDLLGLPQSLRSATVPSSVNVFKSFARIT